MALKKKNMKENYNFVLSQFQRQVIVGTLLGDAHAESNSLARVTYRLKFCQSLKHKAYLDHLYSIFQDCCGAPPYIKKLSDSRSKIVHPCWCFSTKVSVKFAFYGKYFYDKNGRKRIPLNIGRFLTPVVLAYWYMDDGSIKSKESKGMILNTHAFSLKEVELLVKSLQNKFNIEAKPRKQKDGYQIYISGHSYESFSSLILPYMHPTMLYKVPPPRKK